MLVAWTSTRLLGNCDLESAKKKLLETAKKAVKDTDTDTVIFHFDSYINNSARRHKEERMIKNKMYVQRYRIDKMGEL